MNSETANLLGRDYDHESYIKNSSRYNLRCHGNNWLLQLYNDCPTKTSADIMNSLSAHGKWYREHRKEWFDSLYAECDSVTSCVAGFNSAMSESASYINYFNLADAISALNLTKIPSEDPINLCIKARHLYFSAMKNYVSLILKKLVQLKHIVQQKMSIMKYILTSQLV